MIKRMKRSKKRVLAFLMSMLTVFLMASPLLTARAEDGTISFVAGRKLDYGSYVTAHMTFDGDNLAYCVEPARKTPKSGNYGYNLLPSGSPLRKALYYLNGGYGYEKTVKNQYFAGWSDDDSYIVSHLALAYIYDGYSAEGDAFMGAMSMYRDKAVEIAAAIQSMPDPPQNFQAFIVTLEGFQNFVGSWYTKPCGWIELQKSTSNKGISDGNANYSLSGARYGVYKGSEQVSVLTTDGNGYARSGDLEEGKYTLKEIQAPKGYALDESTYDVQVESELTSSVSLKEAPQYNPMDVVLKKLDAETKKAEAQGAASLEGAEFTVRYYTEISDTDPAGKGTEPARTWVFRTDEKGQVRFTKKYMVSGDDFYYQADGKTPCLPLGTVTIRETKAPEGYLVNKETFVIPIRSGDSKETVNSFHAPDVGEKVLRGDLELVKISDSDQKRLAGVPFAITSKTTGESHTIITDKNGYANTAAAWNKHTLNTNAARTSSDGIWFGSGEPDDSRGALLYDTYVIEEQRCKANEGMQLLRFEVEVYKDSATIQVGTLTDDRIEIGTTAKDRKTGSHVSMPDEKVTIVDTVEFEGLKKGQEYKVSGTVMAQDTGKPVLVDGKPVTAEKTFTARKENGSVEIEFTFDASALKGETVVIFEELYQKDEKLAVHADITDQDQTIFFPDMETTAGDAESGEKSTPADEEVHLVDHVAYRNLLPGEYTVTGTIMVKETGEEYLVDGKPVTAEKTFTAEEPDGMADVEFDFNGEELGGKTLVIFETLTDENGKEVASHEDIESVEQSVKMEQVPPEETPETPATPSIPTPRSVVKTGDTANILFWAVIVAVSFIGAAAIIRKKLKK